SRTVYGHERSVLPIRVVMYRSSDQLLPCSCRSYYQCRGISPGSNALDDFKQLLHWLAATDYVREVITASHLGTQFSHLAAQASALKSLLNGDSQFVELEGLANVVLGPELHCFNGR